MNLKYTELVDRIEENLKQVNSDLAKLNHLIRILDKLANINEEISKDLFPDNMRPKEQKK